MQVVKLYLILINAAALLLMFADKQRARKKLWRIPEAILLFCAVIGGSVGALLGMYLARHKTRHLKFSLGLPVILILQVLLLILLR